MIGSIFILSTKDGNILMDRHYESTVPRDVATEFYEEYQTAIKSHSMPSCVPMSGVYLIPVIKNDVLFLGAMWSEGNPLGTATFLRRVIFLLERQYVTKVDTATIKKHFLTVHQLLDEVCDAGIPLNTEPNVAAVLVHPSSGNKLSVAKGADMDLPTECMTAIPWRPATVTHTRNQIFFDVIERLTASVNPDGSQVHCELSGRMDVKAWLSDTPDLVVKLQDPSVLEEVSFHPCVRYKVFEEHKYLSFVPPDGEFLLTTYRASRVVTALPVMLTPVLQHTSGDQWQLTVTATHHSKEMPSRCGVEVLLPPHMKPLGVQAVSGKASVAEAGLIKWTISKWPASKTDPSPRLTLDVHVEPQEGDGEDNRARPLVCCDFEVPKFAASGIDIKRVNMSGPTYKLFKGVKYATEGRVEFRL